jgi:tRNA (cmo5U34)-methyltransferase
MTEVQWSENSSERFIQLGEFLVPHRDVQLDAICAMVPEEPGLVVELSCGEGLLAERILERFPASRVRALDRSPAMLEAAARRLERFGDRQEVASFEIADTAWRSGLRDCAAVVSSLAVHHLDAAGKQRLYADVLAMLRPGGAFVTADVIEPASPAARRWAATTYDEAVRQRSLDRLGDLSAFDEFERLRWNLFQPGNDDDEMDHPATIARHLEWLGAAGYEGADVIWATAGHAVYVGFRPSRQ